MMDRLEIAAELCANGYEHVRQLADALEVLHQAGGVDRVIEALRVVLDGETLYAIDNTSMSAPDRVSDDDFDPIWGPLYQPKRRCHLRLVVG